MVKINIYEKKDIFTEELEFVVSKKKYNENKVYKEKYIYIPVDSHYILFSSEDVYNEISRKVMVEIISQLEEIEDAQKGGTKK